MKDGTGAAGEEQVFSRQEVFDDYLNLYLQIDAEVRPCRDASLHRKASQFLKRNPDSFTLFPFYQAVREKCEDQNQVHREHLTAFIKATETLETYCLNLFLQPWRKEIRTLKTFTGAFVYCLLPVLTPSTIHSVLASIGYLPNHDASQSFVEPFFQPCEFRLSADANVKQAMQLGFELLLARVQCSHLLDLLEEDQLGPQEWMEALQRREHPAKLMDHTGEMKDSEEEKKKKELNKNESPLDLDTSPALVPQPKPRQYRQRSVDQSVMEMQKTYPDLAFRGRRLLPDQPHKAHDATGSNKADYNPRLSKRDYVKGGEVSATDDLNKAFSIGVKASGGFDKNSGRTTAAPDVKGFSNSDENKGDDELSGPQAISPNIILRTGSKAESNLKPRPTEEHPAETQQPSETESVRLAKQEFRSLSSIDEERRDLNELMKRMEQAAVGEDNEDDQRKHADPKGDQNTHQERRQKERNAAHENLGTQETDSGPDLSLDSSRNSGGTVLRQASMLADVTADRLSCKTFSLQEAEDPHADKHQTDKRITFC